MGKWTLISNLSSYTDISILIFLKNKFLVVGIVKSRKHNAICDRSL